MQLIVKCLCISLGTLLQTSVERGVSKIKYDAHELLHISSSVISSV